MHLNYYFNMTSMNESMFKVQLFAVSEMQMTYTLYCP